MPLSIAASVGNEGVNHPKDVRVVQRLLNKHRAAKLAEDGKCGTHTVQAIIDFQTGFVPAPDGRVDPGGPTWRRLSSPPLYQWPLGGRIHVTCEFGARDSMHADKK